MFGRSSKKLKSTDNSYGGQPETNYEFSKIVQVASTKTMDRVFRTGGQIKFKGRDARELNDDILDTLCHQRSPILPEGAMIDLRMFTLTSRGFLKIDFCFVLFRALNILRVYCH